MRDTERRQGQAYEGEEGGRTGHGRKEDHGGEENMPLHAERLVREEELFYDLIESISINIAKPRRE